jgi:outer membrane protein
MAGELARKPLGLPIKPTSPATAGYVPAGSRENAMMKLFRAGSMLLVLGALVVVSRSWSEPPKPPAPRTKIGLVNLAHVVKNYKKYKTMQEEMKAEVEPFQQRDKEFNTQIEELTRQLKDPKTPADKIVELDAKLKKLIHEREENSNAARKVLGKKNEEQMVLIYKEVREAAQKYARANDLELMLHYNDSLGDDPDHDSPMNVARKVQSGACMPLYAAPGIDVSKEILAMLNDKAGGK